MSTQVTRAEAKPENQNSPTPKPEAAQKSTFDTAEYERWSEKLRNTLRAKKNKNRQ